MSATIATSELDRIYRTGGPRALIATTCGSNYDVDCALWAAAVRAHYGPTDLHSSRCNADGTPSTDALRECPSIAVHMDAARERIEALLAFRALRETP